MAFNTQIKLFVTTHRRNNNVSENTLQVWLTLKEQSDQGLQFYKRLKPIFSKEVGFCPRCQTKQWAFVQWDIVQWAFVLVGFCPCGLLSVPRGHLVRFLNRFWSADYQS